MRRLRWPAITSVMTAVTTSAPMVAPIATAAAAPPAGSTPVACAKRVTARLPLSCLVRLLPPKRAGTRNETGRDRLRTRSFPPGRN
jgi:hypothetical protein